MDLARLGFSADTGTLDQAKVKLEALVPAAAKAEKGISGFNAAAAGIIRNASGAATGIQSFAGAVQSAAAGASGITRSALAASTALGTVQRAAAGAAGSVQVMGMAAQQYGPPTAAWQAYQAALAKIPGAANSATSSLNRLGAAANDNINRLQSTPGNIAAQFQDVAVTAAGGMSPLLIALQQGTQLSAAFSGGLRNIIPALAQVFNPVSLLTIAIVALVAAAIQWGIEALNASDKSDKLAQSLEKGAQSADFFGQAQTLVGKVFDTTTGKLSTHNAVLAQYIKLQAQANIVAAQAARQSAATALQGIGQPTTRETLSDFASAAAGPGGLAGANLLSGALARGRSLGPLQGVLNEFSASVNDTALTVSGLDKATNQAIARIDALGKAGKLAGRDLIETKKAVLDLAVARGQEFANQDVVSSITSGQLADSLRTPGRTRKPRKTRTDADRFQDIVEGAQNDIATENARAAALGLSTEAAAELEQRQKLLNAANSAGIKLTDTMRQRIDELAAAYGNAKASADAAAFMDRVSQTANLDLEKLRMATQDVGLYGRELAFASKMTELVTQASQANVPVTEKMRARFIEMANEYADASVKLSSAQFGETLRRETELTMFSLQRERGELGLAGSALEAYRIETQLLAQAKQANVTIDPALIANIRATAQAQAEYIEKTNQMREALDFTREGVKGFVSDLRSGLDQGKSLFSAFASSVLNTLNKVLDKLVDVALNAALGGGGGGVGGFLSGLGSMLGFGGKTPTVTKHAKGAVVNGSTFFRHSAGIGEMGEAGPEGILPLKRGRDGALGVVAQMPRGSQAPQITIGGNTYVISGSSTADMQATVRQSAEQTRDQLRREVPAILQEYQMNGTVN